MPRLRHALRVVRAWDVYGVPPHRAPRQLAHLLERDAGGAVLRVVGSAERAAVAMSHVRRGAVAAPMTPAEAVLLWLLKLALVLALGIWFRRYMP